MKYYWDGRTKNLILFSVRSSEHVQDGKVKKYKIINVFLKAVTHKTKTLTSEQLPHIQQLGTIVLL